MNALTCNSRTYRKDMAKKLANADSLLDQSLTDINRGARLDAMEAVYSASCLIEEIRAALDTTPARVNKSSPVFGDRHLSHV